MIKKTTIKKEKTTIAFKCDTCKRGMRVSTQNINCDGRIVMQITECVKYEQRK